MLQKTKEYDIFKFRTDNRATGVTKQRLKEIVESIKLCNLLEYRPIIVNSAMEILDGQHRLMAAQELNVHIYYQVKMDATPEDILRLNVQNPWQYEDYMNFFCSNHAQEYLKLQDFIKKNNISLKVAMALVLSGERTQYKDFKDGHFVFKDGEHSVTLDLCHRTIDVLKRYSGSKPFHKTTKFWKALIIVISAANFDEIGWFRNIPKFIANIEVKTRMEDYLHEFLKIHNWHKLERLRVNVEENIHY